MRSVSGYCDTGWVKILITGGAGYIGSTIGSAALDAGHEVVILDDLSQGRAEFCAGRPFYKGDVADRSLLDRIFAEHHIDAVVHCAARIVVPESVADPLGYYDNNVAKTIGLLEAMVANGVDRVLFSSSASVYADPTSGFGVTEDDPVRADSPYAMTKVMIERVLADTARATPLRAVALRYFNPIGADPTFRSGQQREHPSHVLGKMMDAWAEGGVFTITGCDWATPDGSGIRDYIHVWDLARAHVATLEHFDGLVGDGEPFQIINVGTGRPLSVRGLADAFQHATGTPLKIAEGPSRPGDVIGAYAVTDRARKLLGWSAELSVAEGLRDAIGWIPRRKTMLGY